MLIVRCPACQTVFRVQPEQLRLRDGLVRCGHCYTPFNALEHQIDEAAAAADANATHGERTTPGTPGHPRTQDSRRFFVLEERIRDGSAAATTQRARESDATPPRLTMPPGSDRDRGQPWHNTADDARQTPPAAHRPPTPPPPATDDAADPLDFEIPEAFLPSRDAASTNVGELLDTPAGDDAADHHADAPAGPPPALAAGADADDGTAWPAHAHTAQPTDDWPPAESAAGAWLHEDDTPEPWPGPVPQAIRYRKSAAQAHPDRDTLPPPATPAPPLRRNRAARAAARGHDEPAPGGRSYTAAPQDGPRWLWGLVVGILGGALAVQAAFLLRLDITRHWPQLRPLYVELCERFNCAMPLPRIATQIRIVNSELESDPQDPTRFILIARVRNEAGHPQEHPHLELTLTDARDRPVVRRVLTPPEWVPAAGQTDGFRAGDEIAAQVPFAAPDVTSAVGYRLYAFYP